LGTAARHPTEAKELRDSLLDWALVELTDQKVVQVNSYLNPSTSELHTVVGIAGKTTEGRVSAIMGSATVGGYSTGIPAYVSLPVRPKGVRVLLVKLDSSARQYLYCCSLIDNDVTSKQYQEIAAHGSLIQLQTKYGDIL